MLKKIGILLSTIGIASAAVVTTSFTFTSAYKTEFMRSIQKIITTANVSAEAQILSNTQKYKNINNYENQSKIVKGVERSTTNADINYKYLLNQFSQTKIHDFLPESDWVKLLNSSSGWDESLTMESELIKNYGSDWNLSESALTSTKDVSFANGSRKGTNDITSILSTGSSLLSLLFGSDFTPAEASLLTQNTDLIFGLLNDYVPSGALESIINSLDFLNKLPSSDQIDEMFANPFVIADDEQTVYDVMNEVNANFWNLFLGDTRVDLTSQVLNVDITKMKENDIDYDENDQTEYATKIIEDQIKEWSSESSLYDPNGGGTGIPTGDYKIDFVNGGATTNNGSEITLNKDGKIYVNTIESEYLKGQLTVNIIESDPSQETENPNEGVNLEDPTIKKYTTMINFVFMAIWYIQQFDNSKLITPDDITKVLSKKISSLTPTEIQNYDRININSITKGLHNFLEPGYNFESARGYINIFLAIPSETNTFKPDSNIVVAPIIDVLQRKSIWDITSQTHLTVDESNLSGESIKTSFQKANQLSQNIVLKITDINWTNSTAKITAEGYTDFVIVDFKTTKTAESPSTRKSIVNYALNQDVVSDINDAIDLGDINLGDINFAKLIQDLIDWINTPNSIPAELYDSITKLVDVLSDILKEDYGEINSSNAIEILTSLLTSLLTGSFDIYPILEQLLNELLFKPLTDPDLDGKPILIGDILYLFATYQNSWLPEDSKIDTSGFDYITVLSGVKNDLFYALYDGGLLKSVFQLVNSLGYSKDDKGNVAAPENQTIPQSVIDNIPDIRSLVDINMGTLFEDILGLDYDSWQFLYGFKNMQLIDIFDAVNNYFKPNDDVTGATEYFLDIGSIKNIIKSFLKTQKIQVEGMAEPKELNNILVLIQALIAGMDNKTMNIGGVQVDDPKKAIVVALGMSQDGKSFIDGSIFDAITQAYGHNLTDKAGNKYEDLSLKANTTKVIGGLVSLTSWLQNTSEKQYYDDRIAEFLDQDNWYTEYVSSKNYEDIHEDSEIIYNLSYKNPKYNVDEKYQIQLFRPKSSNSTVYGNNSFIVQQIKRI